VAEAAAPVIDPSEPVLMPAEPAAAARTSQETLTQKDDEAPQPAQIETPTENGPSEDLIAMRKAELEGLNEEVKPISEQQDAPIVDVEKVEPEMPQVQSPPR
jgi:hypothetical protein